MKQTMAFLSEKKCFIEALPDASRWLFDVEGLYMFAANTQTYAFVTLTGRDYQWSTSATEVPLTWPCRVNMTWAGAVTPSQDDAVPGVKKSAWKHVPVKTEEETV